MIPDERALVESAGTAARALGLAPRAGIVLGSGLGAFADTLDDRRGIGTAELPGFPVSTVAGHAGRLVAGRVGGVPVVVLQGRVHGYEGYSVDEVTHAVRVIARLGARGVILTNAAGAMTRELEPGSLMLVRDHVNLSFWPLRLPPDLRRRLPRGRGGSGDGPDPMSGGIYSRRLMESARAAARALDVPLAEGRLVYGRGPSYETAAEVRVYRQVGGHAACMSTVPEAIAARLAGLEVLAISCISNLGTGLAPGALSHDEVTEIANRVSQRFRRLLTEIVRRAFAEGAGS